MLSNTRRGPAAAFRVAAICLVALPGLGACVGAHAAGSSADLAGCSSAIQLAERRTGIPTRLLHSIGLVESGRPGAAGRDAAPWPWTVNIAGVGYYFASRSAAVAAVEQARSAGNQSIDVGCMQINLLHHPAAFTSVEQAFDPQANANYAAAFLTSLFRETGSWPAAAEAYHSRTPGVAAQYGKRVMAIWPLSGRYGASSGGQERIDSRRIDPHGVYTPEFRARIASDAARRAERDAILRGTPLGRTISLAASDPARSAAPSRSRQQRELPPAASERLIRQPLRS